MRLTDLVEGATYLYSERTADGYPVDNYYPVLVNKVEATAVYLSSGKVLKPTAGEVRQLSVIPDA